MTRKFGQNFLLQKRLFETCKEQLKKQIEVNVWLTQLIQHNEEALIVIKGFGKRLKNKRQLKTYRKEQPTDSRQCTRISAE